jgi:hypothetical protein
MRLSNGYRTLPERSWQFAPCFQEGVDYSQRDAKVPPPVLDQIQSILLMSQFQSKLFYHSQ